MGQRNKSPTIAARDLAEGILLELSRPDSRLIAPLAAMLLREFEHYDVRGYASCRADVVTYLLEEANGDLPVYAGALVKRADAIRLGKHVGAAERAGKAGE